MDKRITGLFVVAFLVTLVVTAPASLLDKFVQHASQGRFELANAEGTLWKGSAIPAVYAQKDRLIALQRLNWSVDASSLLKARVRVRLQWADQPDAPPMGAVLSPRRIELRRMLVSLPARMLNDLSPLLAPVQFRGRLEVRSEQLAFGAQGVEGSAVVDWMQAGSELSAIDPLGNYRVALNAAGGQLGIGLTTISGALLLNGHGNWSPGRGLEFHCRARAAPGSEDSLTELLHHLGPQLSPNEYGFDLLPH